MVDLKKLRFKGYFLHKNGSITYNLFCIYDENYRKSFERYINSIDEEYAILVKKNMHLFVKTFDKGEDLKNFYEENYSLLKSKAIFKTNEIYKSILDFVDIKHKLIENNNILENDINRKR